MFVFIYAYKHHYFGDTAQAQVVSYDSKPSTISEVSLLICNTPRFDLRDRLQNINIWSE
jgi:hypothetical protein